MSNSRATPALSSNITALRASERADRVPGQTKVDKAFPNILSEPPNMYDDSDSQEILNEQARKGRNIGALVTSRAAARDGASVQWYGRRTVVLSKGLHRVVAHGHMCTDTTVSAAIVKDKLLTKHLLEVAGVATPTGALAPSVDAAVRIQRQLSVPVVVKPRFGRAGKGITVNLKDFEGIKSAFHRAAAVDGRGVLVEEHIDGKEFRVLATPHEAVGAVRRLLPHVTGDGVSTIRSLVESKNSLRQRNPNNFRFMIPLDEVTNLCLQRQGLMLADVLPAGESIVVRDIGGVSGGGDVQECLEEIGAPVKSSAVRSIDAIPGMTWGGADILVSRRTGRPYLLELNTDAAISNSTYPVYGRPKDVGMIGWKRLLETSSLQVPGTYLPRPRRPEPLSSASEPLRMNWSRDVSLRSLLKRYLQESGAQLTEYNAGLFKCESPQGDQAWFRGCADENMLSTSRVILKSHQMLRKFLEDSGVKIVPAHRVRKKSEAEWADSVRKADSVVIDKGRGWPGSSSRAKGGGISSTSMLVQDRPPGVRYRIFSSCDGVQAVLGALPEVSFSSGDLRQVGEIAIESVRSVPGLRWALVDIVVPDEGHGNPLVEGLSIDPSFTGGEMLIAGTLGRVFEMVIGGHLPYLQGNEVSPLEDK